MRNFGKIALLLITLISPKVQFVWNSAAHNAFTIIKDQFATVSVFIQPDTTQQFVLCTFQIPESGSFSQNPRKVIPTLVLFSLVVSLQQNAIMMSVSGTTGSQKGTGGIDKLDGGG